MAACSSEKKVEVDELSIGLCNCLKEANTFSQKQVIEISDTSVMASRSKMCLKEYAPKLKLGIKEASDKQAYIKDALKSLLRTDCGIDLFKLVPYNELKKRSK